METKHVIALIAIVAASCGGLLLTTFSRRMRDVAFFLMAALAVLAGRGEVDVNFLGQYWYRGTSRGLGISLIDILAFCVLGATLIAPRYPRRPWFIPASFFLFLVYFIYCAFSVAKAPQWMFGLWELINIPRAMLIMLAAAAYVRTRRELALLVGGLCVAVLIQALFAVNQRVARGMFRPCGTLDHANSLSMYLCTISPLLLAAGLSNFNKWLRWLALAACGVSGLCVLMTLSRAGLPIFAMVMFGTAFMCTTWRITKKKVIIALVITIGSSIALTKSWDMLKARFGSATFKEEIVDIDGENRGIYWRWAKMIIDDDPFGVGLNNWSYMVSKVYGGRVGFHYEDYDDIKTAPEKADIPSIRYAPPAHALAALTIGELGLPGLVIFLFVWFRWFQIGVLFFLGRLNSDPMHRLGIGLFFGIIGIFLQSVTEWTYRQAPLFLTFHLMMGTLASLHWARRHKRPLVREAVIEEIQIQPAVAEAARQAVR